MTPEANKKPDKQTKQHNKKQNKLRRSILYGILKMQFFYLCFLLLCFCCGAFIFARGVFCFASGVEPHQNGTETLDLLTAGIFIASQTASLVMCTSPDRCLHRKTYQVQKITKKYKFQITQKYKLEVKGPMAKPQAYLDDALEGLLFAPKVHKSQT